jgi:hypothetical protein
MLAAIVQFSLRGASVAPVCAKYGPVQHMRRFTSWTPRPARSSAVMCHAPLARALIKAQGSEWSWE